MTLAEILPAVQQLPAAEKRKLARILAEELGASEDVSPFAPGSVFFVATPYNTIGAGRELLSAMTPVDGERH